MAGPNGLAAARQDRLKRVTDWLLGFGVLGLLLTLVAPLPPIVLDLLLAVNLSAAVMLLMLTMHARSSTEISTFPTILLFATLFRLGLNVASTRLILTGGEAGNVIQAFGRYVTGNNLGVGLVVFLVLIIIQFVVITKGSGRVSEVAARFVLDAMPGKQMAIDADLNGGLIDADEARARRESKTHWKPTERGSASGQKESVLLILDASRSALRNSHPASLASQPASHAPTCNVVKIFDL